MTAVALSARSARAAPVQLRCRWNGQSLSSGSLTREHGFTDIDGSRPDAMRYLVEVEHAGRPADTTGYR